MMIYEKMAQAIKQIEAVGKNKDFKDGKGNVKWSFRGVDDAMAAANKVMSELGLSLAVAYHIESDEMVQSDDKIFNKVVLKGIYKIFAIDGSSIDCSAIGKAYDYSDKAMNKAMSAALKYFLYQTFMIPTADVADSDNENEPHPQGEFPKGKIDNLLKAIKEATSLPGLQSKLEVAKKRSWTDEEAKMINEAAEARKNEIAQKPGGKDAEKPEGSEVENAKG
jgi:hypothetical protein